MAATHLHQLRGLELERDAEMIDTYVNYPPTVDDFWLKRCFESVRADPAANVIDAGCVPGNINGTRQASFAKGGGNDFYCFVDGDDLIMPGAIHQCEQYLLANPNVQFVRTREQFIDEVGNPRQTPQIVSNLTLRKMCDHPASAHHLIVTRKSFLPAAAKVLSMYTVHWDWIVAAFAFKQGNGVLLPWSGYQWRQHAGQWCRKPEASSTIGSISARLKEALL